MNNDFLSANSNLSLVRERAAQNYFDLNSLDRIRSDAESNDDNAEQLALEKVGGQFESMLLQEMLSSMRRANEILFEDSLFSSEQVRFYQEMFDQQLTLELGASGTLGIAEQFVRNASAELLTSSSGQSLPNVGQEQGIPLSGDAFSGSVSSALYHQLEQSDVETAQLAGASNIEALSSTRAIQQEPELTSGVANPEQKVQIEQSQSPLAVSASDEREASGTDFLRAILPFAKEVATSLGIKVSELMAQTVLETGWGKKIIRSADGESSFNLFGIKASGDWQGKTANTVTTEFIDGQAIKISADFRKYGSFKESFDDFLQFVSTQPRYAKALNSGAEGFYSALQSAGYATDPGYAEKIRNIAGRIEQILLTDS